MTAYRPYEGEYPGPGAAALGMAAWARHGSAGRRAGSRRRAWVNLSPSSGIRPPWLSGLLEMGSRYCQVA